MTFVNTAAIVYGGFFAGIPVSRNRIVIMSQNIVQLPGQVPYSSQCATQIVGVSKGQLYQRTSSPKQGVMANKCEKEYQILSDVEFTDMTSF